MERVVASSDARFAELRATMSPEERALLVLRVRHRLGWREIADVLAAPSETAAQRRFRALKRRLRRRAIALGLRRSGKV